MSCIALSLPMFQVVPCLKSLNVSRAVAKADMSVLLPSIISLLFRTASISPGLYRGVGEPKGMTREKVWFGARVPGVWGHRETGAGIIGHSYARLEVGVSGLSCLGPFPKSEGRAKPSIPWESWMWV